MNKWGVFLVAFMLGAFMMFLVLTPAIRATQMLQEQAVEYGYGEWRYDKHGIRSWAWVVP
jgi:hypothetical protein